MSKSFLTIASAYAKLGLSGGGSEFIRKSQLISTGKCDESKLTKYGNNDFVVDDDIVKKAESGGLILNLPFTTDSIDRVSGNYIPPSGGNPTYSSQGVYLSSNKYFLLESEEYKFSKKTLSITCQIKPMSNSQFGHKCVFLLGYGGGKELQLNCPESGGNRIIFKTYSLTNGFWMNAQEMSYGTQYNIGIVVENGNYTMFINGTKYQVLNRAFPALTGEFYIGGHPIDNFCGYIKNFKVYDRALTETEIANSFI